MFAEKSLLVCSLFEPRSSHESFGKPMSVSSTWIMSFFYFFYCSESLAMNYESCMFREVLRHLFEAISLKYPSLPPQYFLSYSYYL